jgi:alanine racemase
MGPDVAIDGLAKEAGTISYEMLTRLGSRFHRLYRGG